MNKQRKLPVSKLPHSQGEVLPDSGSPAWQPLSEQLACRAKMHGLLSDERSAYGEAFINVWWGNAFDKCIFVSGAESLADQPGHIQGMKGWLVTPVCGKTVGAQQERDVEMRHAAVYRKITGTSGKTVAVSFFLNHSPVLKRCAATRTTATGSALTEHPFAGAGNAFAANPDHCIQRTGGQAKRCPPYSNQKPS